MYTIISGGSSGLGLSIAKLLTSTKKLIIIGRSEEKLNKAKKSLSGTVLTYSFDISSEIDVKNFITDLELKNIQIESFYNIAGSGFYGPLSSITRNDVDSVLSSNLIGLILMTSNISTYMLNTPLKNQRIISVLSTAALKGKSHETIYNAAKWGARGFLESVRDELKGSNVEVVNVYPGGMQTPFWDESISGYSINTFMNPDDVAKQIVNMTLDYSVFVSDITINRPK